MKLENICSPPQSTSIKKKEKLVEELIRLQRKSADINKQIARLRDSILLD